MFKLDDERRRADNATQRAFYENLRQHPFLWVRVEETVEDILQYAFRPEEPTPERAEVQHCKSCARLLAALTELAAVIDKNRELLRDDRP